MDHIELAASDVVEPGVRISADHPPLLKLKDAAPQPPEVLRPSSADHPLPSDNFIELLNPVEELTVKNYMCPATLYASSSSSGPADPPPARWPNFTRLAGAAPPRMDAEDSFLPPYGIRTKMLPGFPQFAVKTNLKGKGEAANENQRPRTNRKTGTDIARGFSDDKKPDGKALFGDGCGGGGVPDVRRHDGINLREWLNQRECKFSRAERLHLFRQIAELVDITHSQGLALENLRPSYFMILPVNQVKYVGSLVREGLPRQAAGSAEEDVGCLDISNSKRKRYLQIEAEAHLSRKHQKVGENNQVGVRRNFPSRGGWIGGGMKESDNGTRNPESGYRRHLQLGESYYADSKSQNPAISSFGCQLSKSELMELEERWYTSPEELHETVCHLSSNIFNLGVLLFELFCYFDTWEVHCVAMSDLRLRILPPNFLSESPKEASFCLWLLHPEPSSRPKSRDIITSDLVCEGRDTSTQDQSSTSIDEEDAEADLLVHFLLASKDQKQKQAAKLVADLRCLEADIDEAEKRHSARAKILSGYRDMRTNSNENSDLRLRRGPIHVKSMSRPSTSSTNKESLMRNIDQFENAYFSRRSEIGLSGTSVAARSDKDVLKIRDRCIQAQIDADERKESSDRLGTFFEGLCKHARYNRFEVCGTLRNADILNSTNVICSLSFDRDEEYFAAAGVSKKIKIFEFSSLLNDSADIHYPLIEMSNKSMLSCVCWNSYIKNYLASTDYDGVVQLWDASTGQGFNKYTQHQRRAWSVDFSQTDPMKLASGSDDCSVKLWSINEKNCSDTIRNKANVCCVQFSSFSSHFLAFGSADYKIYCYDLRNTRIPWCTLSGHGKAVSYVKFIDSETLVSASTDNTLKLWDLNKTNAGGLSAGACSLTFSGHTNEKNFIGLSVSDGYIACGSETNEVYAYYKTFPMPITSHKFGSVDSITGQETGDDNGQSVSSVCWRTKSNMLVAANSSGRMKLLKLV